MSLDIQESNREEVVILALTGQITFSEADAVRERIRALAATSRLKMVLDLTHVHYIDSTGLGALVTGYTSLRSQGGTLKLVNPSKRNLELLLVTQLHTVFEVFNAVQDAVDSFFPQRKAKHFDVFRLVKEGLTKKPTRGEAED
jgi:anti-sigma B factor antagonist